VGVGADSPDLSHAAITCLAREQARLSSYEADVAERILRYGAPLGCRVEHYPRLTRCMDHLRDLVREASVTPRSGTVVRADTLSRSSGRFSRSWHAPSGGLYLAFIWADTFLSHFSRLFPFAVGIACCETLRGYGVDARLKWVNDVQVGGAKICGILSEMVCSAREESYHLVGIGINVNTSVFPDELSQTATALSALLGRDCDIDEVCRTLLARLQWNIGLLCYSEERMLDGLQGLDPERENLLLERWRELSDTMGRRVIYGYDVQQKPLYQATALDIDDQGGLCLRLADGSEMTEYSGEIIYVGG